MQGIKQIAVCAAALLIGLTACQKSADPLPDMSKLGEIVAVARENGSGTRDQFEMLVGTQEAGAKKTAESTENMMQDVAASDGAIGYAAYNALSNEVKALSIDGVTPEETSIQKENYPLCRSYWLAWSGSLRPVEQDFLTYITTKGQETVEQSCVPVAKPEKFLSDKSGGTISVSGSSSMAPLLTQLAKQYEKENPNATVSVDVTDSDDGLTAAIRGKCDMAMSSRDLRDDEQELLESKAIARDAIAVIVPKDSPLENLSLKQVKAIFDGEITQWKDLK